MKFGDFLNTMAGKLGLQQDPEFISLLSASELANREIPDSLATRFDTGLMSLEGAKNNAALLAHFKPTVLNAVDDQFKILAEKYGIVDAMGSEKNTYKKAAILEAELARRIQEAEAKAASAGGSKSEEVKNLQTQLANLQSQMATLTTTKDKEIADLKAAHTRQELDMLVGFELNGKQYANKDMGSMNAKMARLLLDEALKADKAVLVNDGGVIKMKQAENTQMDFVDAGFKPVSFTDYTNKLLADKKMLAVSPTGGPKPSVVPTPTTVPPNGTVDTRKFDEAVIASLSDLKTE